MLNIKTLAMATAVSAGVIFAMPVAGQAMPQSAPVKVDVAKSSNVTEVRYKKRWKRIARYCRWNGDDPRCYRRYHRSYYTYRYRDYDDGPYYGYYPYRRHHHSPGVGVYFNID